MSITSNKQAGYLVSWLVGGLIVIGVGFSFWDYRNWRHIEKDRYGYGPKEAENWGKAQVLDKLYENQILGLRMRYLGGWSLKEATGGARLVEPKGEIVVNITVGKTNKSLTDVANEVGGGANNDRIYVRGGQGDGVTILTWEKNDVVEQKAVAVKNGKLVEIFVAGKKENWKQWSLTVQEMYKSLVLL